MKILFVDIDHTIYWHKKEKSYWDKKSIKAMKKAQDRGILIYIATARPYDSAKQLGLFDYINPDGIICTNGAVAFINDELLYARNIPFEIVKQIEDVSHKYDLVVQFSTPKDRYFTAEPNEYVKTYYNYYKDNIPPIRPHENENVSSMLLYAPSELDSKILEEIPKGLNYYRFYKVGVDINYYPNNKGYGVKEVLNALKIDKDEALAIGDDNGDVSMFKEVGASVAMGIALPEVKEKATYVTSKVEHHGVYKALKHFKII